jgi:hypothetical protein
LRHTERRPLLVAELLRGKVGIKVMAVLLVVSTLNGLIYAYLLADLKNPEFSSPIGTYLFCVLTTATFAGGFYLLRQLGKPDSGQVAGFGSQSRRPYSMFKIFFCCSAFVHGIIIVELFLTSSYHVLLSTATMSASYLLGGVHLSWLSTRFFSWYQSNRDKMLLLYGLSYVAAAGYFVMTSLSNVIALIPTNPFLEESLATAQVNVSVVLQGSSNIRSAFDSSIFLASLVPSRIAFVLYWVATALLLKHYSRQLGRTKFWVMISMPLIILLVGTTLIYSNFANSQFARAILILGSNLAAGFFFSVIFITTAARLSQLRHERTGYYLVLAGFGIFLFLVSTTAPIHVIDWVHTPAPPFASASWSVAAIAIYLYSFGILYSSSSVSKDLSLRKSLKLMAAKESEMFGTLGTAQLKQELSSRVQRIVREQEEAIEQQSNVHLDMDRGEVESYVDEVMHEITKMRNKS